MPKSVMPKIFAVYAAMAILAVGIVALSGKNKPEPETPVRSSSAPEIQASTSTLMPSPTLTPAPTPTSTPTPTPKSDSEEGTISKTVSVGDIIAFGKYEQDNNPNNGKEETEWLVLAKENNQLLVFSKYALDYQKYNSIYTDVTWETCSLRKWLNDSFLNTAFSNDEQAMIPTVTVSADKNPDFNTDPGNATQDQVFLLSITEANKYFSSDSAWKCKPTEYAKAQGRYVNSNNSNCWWWLRSPGYNSCRAANVSSVGSVNSRGDYVNYGDDAVRPALWINLES